MQADTQTSQLSEVLYLTTRLESAAIPDALREKIDIKIKRLRRMARQGQSAGEYEPVVKYMDWCLSIPWGRYARDNTDLTSAKSIIDTAHYGSERVKDIVLEYLAVMRRKSELGDMNFNAPVLAFVGVQGAGKTSLAMAIAKALGRPFYRLPLGALGSSAELRGAPSDSLSAQPGQIVRALINSQCMNPVILLDEFDKVSGKDSSRKDFMAIMLEILDPQQNKNFKDYYVDYPVDLSKVLFIATANRFSTISRELLDRLEFIEFPDYTPNEKTEIAKRFLFPKVLNYAGLRNEELVITDDAWPLMISTLGKDQGVRRLEQNLQKIARKVIKGIMLKKSGPVRISPVNLNEYVTDISRNVEEVRDKDFTLRAEEQTLPVGNSAVEPPRIDITSPTAQNAPKPTPSNPL